MDNWLVTLQEMEDTEQDVWLGFSLRWYSQKLACQNAGNGTPYNEMFGLALVWECTSTQSQNKLFQGDTLSLNMVKQT